MRVLYLYLLSIRSIWQRVRYDLFKEIVVIICTAVLLGLFYYIFNDFLNIELAKISRDVKNLFVSYFSLTLIFIASVAFGRNIGKEITQKPSIYLFALTIGESKAALMTYFALRAATVCLLIFSSVTLIISRFHDSPLDFYTIPILICILFISIFFFYLEVFRSKKMQNSSIATDFFDGIKQKSPSSALFNWRIKQLFLRNKTAQTFFIMGIIFALFIVFTKVHIEVFSICLSFLSGLMFSFAFIFQIVEDIRYSWIEKNLGVSHQQYLRNLKIIGMLLGAMIGSFTLLTGVICHHLHNESLSFIFALKLFFVAYSSSWIVPDIVFQVDPRSVGIQILSLVLIEIFIGTAIYATPWSIIGLFVVSYYLQQAQMQRFYRS